MTPTSRALGSTCDFGDEFRFGADTLLLETLILKVPERNLDRGELAAWQESPVSPGLLRLRERASFLFDETTARHLARDGSALLCFFEVLAPTEGRYRFHIAPSLDLVSLVSEYQQLVSGDTLDRLNERDPRSRRH